MFVYLLVDAAQPTLSKVGFSSQLRRRVALLTTPTRTWVLVAALYLGRNSPLSGRAIVAYVTSRMRRPYKRLRALVDMATELRLQLFLDAAAAERHVVAAAGSHATALRAALETPHTPMTDLATPHPAQPQTAVFAGTSFLAAQLPPTTCTRTPLEPIDVRAVSFGHDQAQ